MDEHHYKIYEDMTSEFQCPGCAFGTSPAKECEHYQIDKLTKKCSNHQLGTYLGLSCPFALGMPKGFNRPTRYWDSGLPKISYQINLRFWINQKDAMKIWDYLNMPVWALEENGYLFVRVYSPRTDSSAIDIIKGGKIKDIDKQFHMIDMSEHLNEID